MTRLPASARRSLRQAVGLMLLLAGGWSGATAYLALSPAEVLRRADLVVTGTVLEVRTQVEGELVWTEVTFAADQYLSGQPPGLDDDPDFDEFEDQVGQRASDLTLRFLGGAPAGDAPLLVAGMPTFSTGEYLLLALRQRDGLASPVVGFEQGLWRLSDEGARDTVGRYLSLLPAAASQGDALVLGRSVEPHPLHEVLDAVERLLDGETSLGGALAGPSGDPSTDAQEAGDPTTADQSADDPPGLELGDLQATYRVDDFGGPLLLSDAVATAAAAWVELAPGAIVLARSQDSGQLFSYGDEALFDEETFALTLVRGGGRTESLLSPRSGAMLDAALRHELGLGLGLAEGATGVMARALETPDVAPGAAEFRSLAVLAAAVPGDLTGDGRVDFLDLLEFASRYGRSGLNEPADLDRDGVVGDSDLEALRLLYEFTPPGFTPTGTSD